MKLTRVQRARLCAGECPRISGEGKPPERGEVYALSSRLSIRVARVRVTPSKAWRIDYEIYDRRDPVRQLRLTPAPQDFRAIRASFDPHGMPIPPTADAIKAAAEESAYTSAPSSLSSAGEVVDARTQARFSAETQATHARDRAEEYRRRQLRAQAARLREGVTWAERLGVDPDSTLREIDRALRGLELEVSRRKAA